MSNVNTSKFNSTLFLFLILEILSISKVNVIFTNPKLHVIALYLSGYLNLLKGLCTF